MTGRKINSYTSNMPSADARNRLQLRQWRSMNQVASPGVQPLLLADECLRVLVVDDHRDTTDGMALLVQQWGYTAFRAYNWATALLLATETRPHVVLLDISLPQLDGCEVGRLLRAGRAPQSCLIAVITGRGDEASRLACLAAGVDLVFLKPIEPEVIASLLAIISNGAAPIQTELA